VLEDGVVDDLDDVEVVVGLAIVVTPLVLFRLSVVVTGLRCINLLKKFPEAGCGGTVVAP
jgi:hypothetical protein